MAVEPPALVVTLVNAAVPPTAPPKVVIPAVFTVSAKAPLTVLASEMLPAPELAGGAMFVGERGERLARTSRTIHRLASASRFFVARNIHRRTSDDEHG